MILRTLELEGWRCFANPITVGPFSDRVNVVHGPNGIGKSTLMWALVRGLLDNHAVGGQAVTSLRSWGRTLNPRVTIEFEHDGDRLRLAKQFLGSASSELSRFENGQFVRLAEGESADRHVREILGGSAPGRGFTDERHWGLAQVLWAPQDGLKLPELATNVAGAIRASLGAQISDTSQDALERTIQEAYGKIYTSTGKLKGGKDASAVVQLEKDLDVARQQLLELREKVAAFETASRRIEDLRSRRDQAARDEGQLVKDLATARAGAKAYNELCAARDKQREAANAAEARYGELKRRIDDIQTARVELQKAEGERRRLEADSPLHETELRQRGAEAEQARAALETVRGRREQVDTAARKAQRAARFVENRRKAADAERLIAQVTAAQGDLAELTRRRSELVAPDARRLREIQTQMTRREEARLKLAAALITVSIVPEAALELEVLAGEQSGEHHVEPGKPKNVQGSPAVEFRIPGVGTFRATGPTDSSVEQLRDQMAKAEQQLDALTEGFGTRDLGPLQQLQDRADALDKEIARVRVRIETLLGDRRLEEIQRQHAAAAQASEETLQQHPDWAETPPDVEQLEAEADRVKSSFVTDVDEAESRWENAKNAHSLAEQRQAKRTMQLDATHAQVESARRRLDELTADGREDAQREAELRQRAMEHSAAAGKVAEAEKQLKAFAGDPHEGVDILERQLANSRDQSQKAVEELGQVEGRLQQIAAEAPYSAMAETEETLSRLEESIAAEKLHNDAIRLLHETIRDCRSTAVEAVLGPVQQRASRTMQRIAGSRLGEIRFSESFLPELVSPESLDNPVAIDQISGGECEQVHLAVRLALADVLFDVSSDRGRQLVVLDDVLTATDTARLARTLRILEEAADRFQVLILTCHPERYRGLPDAEFIDLEKRV